MAGELSAGGAVKNAYGATVSGPLGAKHFEVSLDRGIVEAHRRDGLPELTLPRLVSRLLLVRLVSDVGDIDRVMDGDVRSPLPGKDTGSRHPPVQVATVVGLAGQAKTVQTSFPVDAAFMDDVRNLLSHSASLVAPKMPPSTNDSAFAHSQAASYEFIEEKGTSGI